jgi:VWFA-related protein
MTTFRIGLSLVASALILLAPPASAQFRSSTELVSIYATVQDRSTRLVPDLTKDDFIVTDNGKAQPITFFSNEVTPFSAVVMLDRSRSMLPLQFVVRDAASEFIRRLLPGDKARVGSFGDFVGNRVMIEPPSFSSSKEELLEVLRAPIRAGNASPVWISIDQSISALRHLPGRRVVLIFSDGYDEPAPSIAAVTLKQLVERAREANVMIYALGFTEIEPREGRAPVVTLPHRGLRALADDSGGGYFEIADTADLAGTFTRVAEELHRQYWLGFAPPARDGKVHTISVTVKRPDMTVRARQSYVAPKPQ